MLLLALVVLLLQTVLVNTFPATSRGKPLIDLGYSVYEGVRLDAGVDQFLGMRYAAPPLGDLRFRAPQDPPCTKTTQSAFKVSILRPRATA